MAEQRVGSEVGGVSTEAVVGELLKEALKVVANQRRGYSDEDGEVIMAAQEALRGVGGLTPQQIDKIVRRLAWEEAQLSQEAQRITSQVQAQLSAIMQELGLTDIRYG